jgi:hypothetical protein
MQTCQHTQTVLHTSHVGTINMVCGWRGYGVCVDNSAYIYQHTHNVGQCRHVGEIDYASTCRALPSGKVHVYDAINNPVCVCTDRLPKTQKACRLVSPCCSPAAGVAEQLHLLLLNLCSLCCASWCGAASTCGRGRPCRQSE